MTAQPPLVCPSLDLQPQPTDERAGSEPNGTSRGALPVRAAVAGREPVVWFPVLLALGGLAGLRGAAVGQHPINETILAPRGGDVEPTGPHATAIARARPAVVHVRVEVAGDNTFALERPASGVVLTPAGLVVTHWDLVREAEGAADKTIFVCLAEPRGERLRARIAARDDASGLALLQVELPAGRSLAALPLAAEPHPGDPASVLCLHDGEDSVAFAGVVTPALGRFTRGSESGAPLLDPEDVVLTDAAIPERAHGAALLSAGGGLLGICSASRVVTSVGEPTLAELKRPSFGFAIGVRALRRAFPDACAAAAGEPAFRSPSAAAVAAVRGCVVAVHAGGARPPLGTDDPYGSQRRDGVGSGVVVDRKGLVLTNGHLVRGADTVTVTLPDGTSHRAEVLQTHARSNTALLRVPLPPERELDAISCGTDDVLVPGQELLVVGHPEGTGLTVRAGVLSARRGQALQVDAGIGNHNGGGAIVTLGGVLVGIADAGVRDQIDVAFERRGDQAKVDASLDVSPGIDGLRQAYRAELDRYASADGSLHEPVREKSTPGDVAAIVERTAGALLNVFVEFTTAAAELEDNPFAASKGTATTEGLGSGVVIDRSGLALTNWHVVESATLPDGRMRTDRQVRVSLRDGRTFPVTVLSISREEDLALLRLELGEGETVEAVALGHAAAIEVGDQAIAVGNPHGRANTVTVGVVSAKNQSIRVRGRWRKLPHLLETDAAINAGNSGGALLDSAGRLIGINSAGGSQRSVTGYAIHVDHVRDTLRRVLLAPEKLRSAWCGIDVFDHQGRVLVQAVDRNGPGAAAGIQVDDVLCALDGSDVRWSVGWALAWLDRSASPVPVVLERGGERITVQLTPWTSAARAVYRQTSLRLGELTVAGDAALVRDAALAAWRRFVGDPAARPSELPGSVVRVEGVHPELAAAADVRAGDVLVGIALREVGRAGDAATLHRFEHVAEVQSFLQERASYEGETFRVWLYRGGAVHEVELVAKRLLW